MDALDLLSYGNAVGELVVFTRLASLRLLRRYKWFAAWMGFSAIRDGAILIATSAAHMKTDLSWTLWQGTEPFVLGLEVLVVVEIYDLIATTYPGAVHAGKLVLSGSIGVAVFVTLILGVLDWRGITPWMFQVKRWVTSLLVVFLLCVAWVFLWFAAPLARNLVYHCRILTVYLAGIAAGYLIINIGISSPILSELFLSCCLVCLILWAILFSRDGERPPPMEPISPEDAERNRRLKEYLLRILGKLKVAIPDA